MSRADLLERATAAGYDPRDDAPPPADDCPDCGGSGGGDEPHLRCPWCAGRGTMAPLRAAEARHWLAVRAELSALDALHRALWGARGGS